MMMTMLFALMPLVSQTPPRVSDVGWLAGCWELTRGSRHVVEQWTAPEGGTLMGVSRTVVDGKTTEWEFLIIREGPRGLEYAAKPSFQAEAVFSSVTITHDEAAFENPQHDFPKRIVYRRQADGGSDAVVKDDLEAAVRKDRIR
jgi:hypothetical protein